MNSINTPRLLRVHRRLISLSFCVLCFMFRVSSAAADVPASQPAGAWSEVTNGLQARMSFTGEPAIGSSISVKAELKNAAATELPKETTRVWLLFAQDAQHVYYTSPFAATGKVLAGGEVLTITFDSGTLDAFRYAGDINVKNGIPTSADPKAPAPQPLGKVGDVLVAGGARVKAFVVLTQESADELQVKKTVVVATPTISVTLTEAPPVDFSKLDAAGQKAFFGQITAGLRGDPVTAKKAHDRAVNIGAPAVQHMLSLVDDKTLSGPGQMWLAATLVELKDPRCVDPLIKIVERGGPGAKVAAYHGPELKDAKLNAAIQKAASASKDQDFISWAVRGLGTNGEKTDANLLQIMVEKSDPAGRAEAAVILAAHPDPKAIPLLAKLINDPEPTVSAAAILAAFRNGKKEDEIVAAMQKATTSNDPETKKIAKQYLDRLKNGRI